MALLKVITQADASLRDQDGGGGFLEGFGRMTAKPLSH